MNLIEDKALVQQCLLELKKQMGYADNTKLSQRDIEHLCEAIEEKTKILISLSTIKRILNGQFDRLPQSSTLNALTIFIGYTGWHDFKAKKLIESPVEIPTVTQKVEQRKPTQKPFLTSKVWLVIVFVVVVLLIALLLKSPLLGFQNMADKTQFSARQTSSEGVPNSVVFSYNVDKIEADSFHIQQSWNEKARVSILKNNHTLTDIYYEPGYHNAKLMANGKVLKQVGVNITTKDWFCYTKPTFRDILPKYFKEGNAIHDGILGLTDEAFARNNIDFEKDQLYFYTFCPKLMDIEGDNFKYKVRFRLRKIKSTLCPWVISEVFCQNSFIYFTNTIEGCISEINAKISDKTLSGKTTDLSAFGCNLTEWQELEMQVVNKKVAVYLGNKKVFEQSYDQTLGLIAGMGFVSNGICEVDKVALQDLKGKVIYKNEF